MTQDHLHQIPDKDEPNLVWREKPNPKDPQAELREAIYKIVDHATNQWDDGNDYTTPAVDELFKLFQAHQQELLSELLRDRQFVKSDEGFGNKVIEAVPVSVIERLQNKTNDGGRNGDSNITAH